MGQREGGENGQRWEWHRCPVCGKVKKLARNSKRNWYKAEGPVNSNGDQPQLVCAHCAGQPYRSKTLEEKTQEWSWGGRRFSHRRNAPQ